MAGYELIYYLTATGERIGYYGEDDVTVHIHISHCICNIKTTLLAFDHRQTSSAIRSYTTFAWSVMSEGLGMSKGWVSYPWRIDNVFKRLSRSTTIKSPSFLGAGRHWELSMVARSVQGHTLDSLPLYITVIDPNSLVVC